MQSSPKSRLRALRAAGTNGVFVQVRQLTVFDDHLAPRDVGTDARKTQPEQQVSVERLAFNGVNGT